MSTAKLDEGITDDHRDPGGEWRGRRIERVLRDHAAVDDRTPIGSRRTRCRAGTRACVAPSMPALQQLFGRQI